MDGRRKPNGAIWKARDKHVLSDSLFVPTVILAVLAWVTPVLLSRVMAEGLRPLMLLALYSTLILFTLAGGFFYALYLVQGASTQVLGQFGLFENIRFFGRLGLSSALIWAPIMILSVMNRPRYWVKETW